MWAIAGRSFAYLLLLAASAELVRLETVLLPVEDRFSERGRVEIAQSLLLVLTVAALVFKAVRDEAQRALAVCLALAFSILLIRENDQAFERWFMDGAWKYFAAVCFALLLAWFFRHRREVIDQFLDFARGSAFGLLLGGMLALAFSRFLGSSRIWVPLMGDAYLPIVKDTAQEGGELGALVVLFLATVEFTFFTPSAKAVPRSSD